MIKIPAKIRYAIRTLVELGVKDKTTPLKQIEKTQGISAKFAKQILQPLEKCNLVKSKRGVYGGYYLAKSPTEISLIMILNAFKESNKIVFCLQEDQLCQRESICGVHSFWKDLQGRIDDFFTDTTIQDIIRKEIEL